VTYVSCSSCRRPGVPGCAFRHFVRGCHARDSSTGHKQEHQHHGCFAIDISNTQSRTRLLSPKTTTLYTVPSRDTTSQKRQRINQSPCSSTRIPQPYVAPTPTQQPSSPTNTSQLIAQCTSHFKIANDKTSLHRINESLSTLSEFRTQHLRSIQSSLAQLNRTHQTLSANHSHTLSQHNPTNHAAEILRLDTNKFKIAKQASDLEVEGERLQSDLQRLGSVRDELEEEGVEGGAVERPGEDATV
jgi:hypothetical protein